MAVTMPVRLSRVLLKWGGDPSPGGAVVAGFGGPSKTLERGEGSPCRKKVLVVEVAAPDRELGRLAGLPLAVNGQ
jgi:hypothetical protein